MRKTLGVSLLVLLMTVPASAGIMQNGSPEPPPPPAPAAQEPSANGYMQNDSADSLTQIALGLLAALF